MTRAEQIFTGPNMILYHPTTPDSDSIERPNCCTCGTATILFGIETERPGYELRTFVCPRCDHIETAVGTAASLHSIW